MKLWKETGTNPFKSCLPLLLEMPIFFALYRVIEVASRFGADGGARGFMAPADAESLRQAMFAGAKVGDTLMTFEPISINDSWNVKILALVLIVGISGMQFSAQWKLLHSELPPGADDGPFAQEQKFVLYAMPVAFGVGGLALPLGVLVHWLTWFVWTAAEQAYIIRDEPRPGSSGGMGP